MPWSLFVASGYIRPSLSVIVKTWPLMWLDSKLHEFTPGRGDYLNEARELLVSASE